MASYSGKILMPFTAVKATGRELQLHYTVQCYANLWASCAEV